MLAPTGALPLPFFAVPDVFPQRNALLALYAANSHSDTILAEWRAFPESARIVSEIAARGTLPVQVVTALNSYHEQPLPGQDPTMTTQIWTQLQQDQLNISTNSQHYVLEEATHFSLLANPDHAAEVMKWVAEMVERIRESPDGAIFPP